MKGKNMAVKESENGGAETVATATNKTTTTNETDETPTNQNEEFKWTWFFSFKGLLKISSYITVEPVVLCWLLPSCLLYIAVENLALEKSCRVNFNYSDAVCDNMIDKSINNINCVTFREKQRESLDSFIHLYSDFSQVLSDNATFKNGTAILPPGSNATILFDITELEELVCQAEIDSQILDSKLTVYTASFDMVFGIIMVLFAGGWSDRRGRRKPCMLIPLLGELAALLVFLIAAIFFKQLPLEFSAVLGRLLPAITGGANLFLMGVYSYLAETTTEEDRTMRFGIFAQIVTVIPIASLPWSGIMLEKLGYVPLVLLCIPINLIGVYYVVFKLKEVKRVNKEEIELTPNGVDNPAFDNNTERNPSNGHRETVTIAEPEDDTKKPNCLLDFFNPIVAIECAQVVMRERKNSGRAFLVFLFIMYFVAIGPSFGEEPNEYNFTRIALNWDGILYSAYATYGNTTSLVGITFMVVIFSKMLKFSDPTLGILGSSLSSVSRICYTIAEGIGMMYIARTLDAFISIRALVIKSTLSKMVEADELGRSFSIIAILEAFGKFVFVSLYTVIYANTLENWPAAFYFVSFIFLVLTALLFVALYFIVKRRKKQEEVEKAQLEAAASKQPDLGETTHM